MIFSKAQLVLIVPTMLAVSFVQKMAIMVQDGSIRILALLPILKIQRQAWTHGHVMIVVAAGHLVSLPRKKGNQKRDRNLLKILYILKSFLFLFKI